jgi:phosphatidylserine synthase 2
MNGHATSPPREPALKLSKGLVCRVLFTAPMVVYVLLLWLMTDDNARLSLKNIDSKLGKPLPEKDYALDCSMSELADKIIDPFVLAHGIGWMVNAMLARTWKEVIIISGVDELCEVWWRSSYGNFRECWWDHLILDMILTNGLGAYLGAQIMKRFFNQSRDYIGLFAKDKLKRGWLYAGNLLVLKAFSMFLLFGFKSVLWIPPSHWLNIYRMLVYCVFLEASLTQIYDAVQKEKRGWRSNTWALAWWAVMAVDALLVFKMGYHIPIWNNMNLLGKVLFWVGTALGLSTFRAFFI